MKRDKLIHFRQIVARVASVIEALISVVVLVAIVITGIRVAAQMVGLVISPDLSESFEVFLSNAFNVVIGIEFVKMLAKHSPGSAIEVLLFAIARQMVVEHTTPVENLISIVAILLIFVIRKYLFVPAFGSHLPGEDTFSPSSLEETTQSNQQNMQ